MKLICLLVLSFSSFLFLAEKVTVIQEVKELPSNSFLLTVIPAMKEPYIDTPKESKKEQKGN